jgi:putative acetyltransferase
MEIRESTKQDLIGLLAVEEEAFGETEGPVIVKLVIDLLMDPTALPLLSLIALHDQEIVGHALFTKTEVNGFAEIASAILAPLAVKPGFQKQGIGGSLMNKGLKLLADAQIKLVFVLGHPEYYPRFGFKPAGRYGLDAPYPIPADVEEAWMVLELSPGYIETVKGKVKCAEALDHPEHWAE